MTLSIRDRWIIGMAAALSVIVPTLLLWPQQPELREQPVITTTPLPPISLVLTGAATTDPLFNPDRSPAPPTPEVHDGASAAPVVPPVLAGIAFGRGGAVVLLKTATGETVRASIGDEVDGWRIAAITRDHAVAEKDGDRVDLGFDLTNKASAAPPTPATSINPAAPAGQSPPLHPGQPTQ